MTTSSQRQYLSLWQGGRGRASRTAVLVMETRLCPQGEDLYMLLLTKEAHDLLRANSIHRQITASDDQDKR